MGGDGARRWRQGGARIGFRRARFPRPASLGPLERFDRVETLGFDYGQRNRAELACRRVARRDRARLPRWAARLGADHVIDLPALNTISESALTRDLPITCRESRLRCQHLVPGRNVVFLTFAAALAYGRALKHLVPACARPDTPAIPTAATIR